MGVSLAGRVVRVATVEQVDDGELLAVTVDGKEILLARVGQDIFALGNVCTHAQGWLDMGTLHTTTHEVECPLHEGRFDLRTGMPTSEPCVEPVSSYRVTVEDGDIFVHLVEPHE